MSVNEERESGASFSNFCQRREPWRNGTWQINQNHCEPFTLQPYTLYIALHCHSFFFSHIFPARATKMRYHVFFLSVPLRFFMYCLYVNVEHMCQTEREREREKVPAGRPAQGRWGSVSKNSAVAKTRSKYKQRHNPASRTRAVSVGVSLEFGKHHCERWWERSEGGRGLFSVFSAKGCCQPVVARRCLLRKCLYSCMAFVFQDPKHWTEFMRNPAVNQISQPTYPNKIT